MQLEAELQLLGFEVVHAPAIDPTRVRDLQALARELDVAAAILVDPGDAQIDLWVVDRTTGKTVVRTVAIDDPRSHDAARVAAVRAIDLLRASFRELEDAPPPPEAEVKATPPVRRTIRRVPRRFGLTVGPAVAGAAGGLGATAHVAIAFEAMPHPVFGIGVRGFVPVVGARVTAPEGAVRVHVGWITVGPRFALRKPDRIVLPSLGVSVGAAFAGMRGEAEPPYEGHYDLVASAMFELDAALAIAVHSRVRIWLDASVGAAVPRVGVRIAGERVATWGTPLGAGVLGVQFVF